MHNLEFSLRIVFIIFATCTIFQMQLGICMLECGFVTSNAASNILLKNIVDMFISAVAFYLVGYSFMNEAQGGFIGSGNYFFSSNLKEEEILSWLYQFSFCAVSSTIVSGSLSERVTFDSYIVFCFFMGSFIYPIAAAWCWGNGWLAQIGFRDFAGSGVVHLLGGASGLVGTIIMGPRYRAFDETSKAFARTVAQPAKPVVLISVENTEKSQT